MKNLLSFGFILTIFFGLTAQAKPVALQPGDVLLVSYNCYECRMIESETESPYSHSGLVLRDASGKLVVAQALGIVHVTSFESFLRPLRKETKALVLRPKVFAKAVAADALWKVFDIYFRGLPFDSEYRWHNFDDNGHEKLYCSEFILKFLNHFMTPGLQPVPISYEKHFEYWKDHFGGSVPRNEVGNYPGYFAHHPQLTVVGEVTAADLK